MFRRQSITIDIIAQHLENLGINLARTNTLVRVLGCLGIWQAFERLRNQNKPFDRAALLTHIASATVWAERNAADMAPAQVGGG